MNRRKTATLVTVIAIVIFVLVFAHRWWLVVAAIGAAIAVLKSEDII
jgi:hypothetical protein